MKRNLILLLTLMPFLALGQSNSYNTIFGNGFEKNPIYGSSNDLERNLQTTLINDIKYSKSVLNLDLGKSYGLSLTLKSDKTFNVIDNDKLDEMLLKFRPLKNFKWQFREPNRMKSLFEN